MKVNGFLWKDYIEYLSQHLHGSENLSGNPESYDNKIMNTIATPTTTGTTTVVTTTASSGNYARFATTTTSSLPSTCPGIVHSRQQTAASVGQRVSGGETSSNGYVSMGIYDPCVPQASDPSFVSMGTYDPYVVQSGESSLGSMGIYDPCVPQDGEPLLGLNSSDASQLAETRPDTLSQAVDSAVECCMGKCEMAQEMFERIESGYETDPSSKLVLQLEEIARWVDRMESLEIQVFESESEYEEKCRMISMISMGNRKIIGVRAYAIDIYKTELSMEREQSELQQDQVHAVETPNDLVQVPQFVDTTQAMLRRQQVQNGTLLHANERLETLVEDDELHVDQSTSDENDNNVEKKSFSQIQEDMTVVDNNFQLIDNEDDLNIIESDDNSDSDVDVDSVGSDYSIDSNLEKKPFPQVPNKVTNVDSNSVISDNSTESNLNMKHLVHEQQVLAQAQQDLVQQEKLLQSQVRQVRLGVLEFMQTCLGQLVLQTTDKYGSQHRLNHKWQSSWKGSVPDFCYGSAGSAYGT